MAPPAVVGERAIPRPFARRWAWLLACGIVPGLCASAQSATWAVGPDGDAPTVAEALLRAADGDVIEVRPGIYRGDVAVIAHKRLAIVGVGRTRPVFVADGRHAEGKAIWVVRGGDITIDNIEFRGARVPDLNGAGIRFERGRLHIVHCRFVDNEMGLLTSNVETAELTIEDSEFTQAPTHPGSLHHLLYVGRIARFSVSGSRFSQGHVGHLIKSRARHSTIIDNTIVDGPLGSASYEIDLPNGGLARIAGNTIGQSEHTQNVTMVAFGAEGTPWPQSALTVEGNTLLNERKGQAWFVRAWREHLPPDTAIDVRGNRFVGDGALSLGTGASVADNTTLPRP